MSHFSALVNPPRLVHQRIMILYGVRQSMQPSTITDVSLTPFVHCLYSRFWLSWVRSLNDFVFAVVMFSMAQRDDKLLKSQEGAARPRSLRSCKDRDLWPVFEGAAWWPTVTIGQAWSIQFYLFTIFASCSSNLFDWIGRAEAAGTEDLGCPISSFQN